MLIDQTITSTAPQDNHCASAEATVETLAAFLKAAADPLRLQILRVLARDSFGVLELASIVDCKQSGLSHHLKVLASAGWITSRREGNSIFYRRAYLTDSDAKYSIQQGLFQQLDQSPLSATIVHHINALQTERAKASAAFFDLNAHKFREQQDLIASYPVYAEQVTQLLSDTPLQSRHSAIEIGPGEGEFLSVLSSQFAQVTGIDTSAEMLHRAQQYVTQAELTNVQLLHGDSQRLAEDQLWADCVVLNMVLHHTPSPADIIQHIATALNPGGALLITDLCRHDQSWARDACGDTWQGFDPEDFTLWATNAGLEAGQDIYFALRNGFQIQIRQFFQPAD